ncbi:MAG: hypothetical protein M3322_13345 [Actinomycetota bacterium]|nr:hypothetical protein [Actinomycetota bacterium]
MSERADVTCDDCYFRRSGLCALAPDRPCPTFRPFTRGSFAPPLQPRLGPELGRLAAQYAVTS